MYHLVNSLFELSMFYRARGLDPPGNLLTPLGRRTPPVKNHWAS